ncbi:invasin domain 3-containing protein, partial [Citrobacter sp. S2-9]
MDSFSDADGCTRLARFIVWLNILLQFIFPLAGAFTPAIVHAQRTVSVSADAVEHSTQVYTLGRGESVLSIAKKYHLTLEELRKLNQFRTFAHGFSGLQAGDELDVPAAKMPQKKPTPASDNAPDEQQQKIAGLASQAGSFLSNSPDGQAAQSLVTGMVTGEASSRLQQMLSRYGTARVQVGMDENFSLKNSEFDLLLPLWEQQSTLLFTQGSLHRTDDRTQSNLGLGLRYFTDNWMVGGNTFLDYDLSRDHSRMGLGLEYGRDFLKLSANGYQRLSNWKNSPDVEDYDERPANGWDVRAEGWLPALPQLGGKIVYEQYYGDEVALSDKDDRQRNPHAITLGLNYTPVPLITLNAEQRQGSADDNETRVGLDLNYQLGVPWTHQIDPDGVAAMHTLNGSRYDLVERNNSIVLEYRKQEVIRLKTAALVTGNGGERKSLDVTVNSKHGVKRIDWSAASLLAAGGKIIANSTTSYDVLLPSWQSAQGANNTYLVTGVAVDNNDNRSTPSDTQITVNTAEISVANSHFLPESPLKSSPTTSYLPADGKTQGVATLTLVNDQQQPVDVPLSDITLTTAIAELPVSPGALPASSKRVSGSSVADATVSAFTRKSSGVYEVTVTAGTKPELLTMTPVVRKTALNAVRFFITPTAPDAGQSTFAANPKTVLADNTAVSTLTLVVKDASGSPLSGIAGNLSVSVSDSHGAAPIAGSVTISSITETATAGTYTATLKGTKADTYTLKPQYKGSVLGSLSDTVTLTAGTTPDAGQSAFSVSPKLLVADGITTSTLTLTVKDVGGNALTGVAGNLTAIVTDSQGQTPATGSINISAMTETATAGTYTATLSGTLAGSYKVVPQFSGNTIGSLSDTLTLTAVRTPDGDKSVFTASPITIAADSIATSTLTLVAKDANGNAIGGIASSLTLNVKDSGGSTPAADKVTVGSISESVTPGTYTATLKGTLAGIYTVKPQFSGSALGSLSATVTLTAGNTPDGTQSTFSTSPKLLAADNTATSTLKLMAKDAGGNAITGLAADLTFAVKDSGGVTPTEDKVTMSSISEGATPGTYIATLKGTLAGAYSVKPQYKGSAIGSLSDAVVLTADTTPDGAQSTFSAAPVSVAADNIAISTLTLVARDAYGNAVKGIASSLTLNVKDSSGSTPAADKVTVGSISESATPGTYTATLKGTLAGIYTVKPQFSGSALGSLSATVTLRAGNTPDGTQSTFSASPSSITANDTATSTLTLKAKDAGGNAITGIAADLTFAVKDSNNTPPDTGRVTVGSITESATPGTYTATLKGTLAGVYTVKPQFSGSALGNLSAPVTLTADNTPDGNQSTFSATPKSIVANDTAKSLLTLKVKDANGNAITGIATSLTVAVKDSQGGTPEAGKVTVSAVTETEVPGTYIATLKGQLADTYTLKPQFSGNAIGTLS